MFQGLRRAKFLAQNNHRNVYTNDIVSMYQWLIKNAWPADRFVDLFMRCHVVFDPSRDSHSFKLYMESQYLWVHDDDVESLNWLFKTIDTPQYRGVDKDGLVEWTHVMVQGAKNRS